MRNTDRTTRLHREVGPPAGDRYVNRKATVCQAVVSAAEENPPAGCWPVILPRARGQGPRGQGDHGVLGLAKQLPEAGLKA